MADEYAVGKRGFFYESWAYGDEDWLRVSVPATECGRISAEFLKRARQTMGVNWFQQEYMCEFVDLGAGVFGRELLEGALDDEVNILDFLPWR